MAKICPRCHTASTDDFKYCPHCNTRLPEAGVKPSGLYDDHGHAHSTPGPELPDGPSLFNLFKRDEPTSGKRSFSGGWSQTEHPHNYVPAKHNVPNAVNPNHMTMGWHTFLVTILLFFMAFINFFMGVSYLTGDVHENSVLVYSVFPLLQTRDRLFGFSLMLLAALTVTARFRLAGFKRNGPALFQTVIALMLAVQIAYCAIYTVIVSPYLMLPAEDYLQIVMNSVGLLVFMLVNRVYYAKRAHFFINL